MDLHDPVVIFLPAEGFGRGYLCGVEPHGAITRDNVDFAKEFATVDDAIDFVLDHPVLRYDAAFFEYLFLSAARAKDDQEYEAERQEML